MKIIKKIVKNKLNIFQMIMIEMSSKKNLIIYLTQKIILNNIIQIKIMSILKITNHGNNSIKKTNKITLKLI